MTFSYTQISSYLSCPRRYCYQYLEGWQERQTRASMLFGRAFERALASYFLGEDCAAILHREWSAASELGLTYAAGESWEVMLRQGVKLLDSFAQQDRIRVPQPERHLQIKVLRRLSSEHDFVGFIDAVGELDGTRCLIDWKTGASCYPAQPENLASLDPQLVCYSWLTGLAEVALVMFVRKRWPEIQYLRATISESQREDYGLLVQDAIRQIERAQFPQHSGIRFPQSQCVSCPFFGLCLENQQLIEAKLTRTGVDLGWLDQLVY